MVFFLTVVARAAPSIPWLEPCAAALNAARAELVALDPRFGDPPEGLPTGDRALNAVAASVEPRSRTVDGQLVREDQVRLRFEYLDDTAFWVVVATEPPAPDEAWMDIAKAEGETFWSRRVAGRRARVMTMHAPDPARVALFQRVMLPAADRCLTP